MTEVRSEAPERRSRTARRAARWESRYKLWLTFTDVAIVISTVAAAQVLRFGVESAELKLQPTDRTGFEVGYTTISVGLIVLWLLTLRWFDTYSAKVIGIGATEYKRVLTATFTVFGCLAIAAFALRTQVGRGYVLIALPLGLTLLLIARWLWRKRLHREREKFRCVYRTLIVGDRVKSELVVDEIRRSSHAGYELIGAVTELGTGVELRPGVPVVADYDGLIDAVDDAEADALILTSADALTPGRLREIGWQLESREVEIIASIAITGIAGPRIHTRPVSGLPLVHLEVPTFSGSKYYTKRLFDIVGSALGIALVFPLALLIALLIRLETPGPVLFRQERVGIGGKPFTMLKFRSMVVDAEARRADLLAQHGHRNGLFKLKQDPRVTRVGAVIRKYSLDELPQLLNVFRGDMSMVGPRPPLPSEVADYERWVHRRLLVKPGITGLWQVSGRSDLSWDDSVRLDLYYVENWSLLEDLIILLRTVRTVISPKGAY